MDRHMLALFIPILALSIPVAGVVFYGIHKMMRLRIEEARVRAGGLGGAWEAEVDQLRAEVDQLRRELSEVSERMDFTERLLSRQADRERLPGA
jgi:hypothetical protein